MKQRKFVAFTLVLVMVAVIAMSVNTVLAGGFVNSFNLHTPVCEKSEADLGAYTLNCFDVGKDIVNVQVKTNAKYDLQWDDSQVMLRVYPENFSTTAYWFVQDKVGNVVSGRLP